jgi:prepilin-type N-terminal cleavage/methylation domain-containing protein
MRPRPTGISQAGFALIEMLVALALLALAIALMPGALRLGARAWEARGDLERSSGTALAMALVERRIAEAMTIYERDDSGGIRIAFVGTERTLSFIAAAANGPAGGGVYRYRLAAADASVAGLALRLSLYRPGETDPSPPAETRTLIAAPAEVRFRYFGQRETAVPPQWHDTWSRPDAFPALVEITVTSSTSKRRSVVAPRLDARQQ